LVGIGEEASRNIKGTIKGRKEERKGFQSVYMCCTQLLHPSKQGGRFVHVYVPLVYLLHFSDPCGLKAPEAVIRMSSPGTAVKSTFLFFELIAL
jgi:hypothetical protein